MFLRDALGVGGSLHKWKLIPSAPSSTEPSGHLHSGNALSSWSASLVPSTVSFAGPTLTRAAVLGGSSTDMASRLTVAFLLHSLWSPFLLVSPCLTELLNPLLKASQGLPAYLLCVPLSSPARVPVNLPTELLTCLREDDSCDYQACDCDQYGCNPNGYLNDFWNYL